MSIGNMSSRIDIIEKTIVKDAEGFSTEVENTVVSIRAYREGRHGSEKWANRAQFTEATDLFRFRCIPGVEIKTDMVILCEDKRFEITSVENVKGRNIYTDCLVKVVETVGKS